MCISRRPRLPEEKENPPIEPVKRAQESAASRESLVRSAQARRLGRAQTVRTSPLGLSGEPQTRGKTLLGG